MCRCFLMELTAFLCLQLSRNLNLSFSGSVTVASQMRTNRIEHPNRHIWPKEDDLSSPLYSLKHEMSTSKFNIFASFQSSWVIWGRTNLKIDITKRKCNVQT